MPAIAYPGTFRLSCLKLVEKDTKMYWDAVGAVAELAGALGVIASLVYLARQIKQSNASDRMNTTLNLQALTMR